MKDQLERLRESLKVIDKMLNDAKTDKRIDVDDLKEERRNCVLAIKKLEKKS